MGYKTSIVIFLQITFEFLTPAPPLQGFEKKFFKIYFLKVTRNIKSDMLITNIAITKFKNVILKNRIIFSISEFWGPNQVFGVQTRFLTLLSHRLVSRRSRKASFRCDLLSSIRIWVDKNDLKWSAVYNSEIRVGSAWSPFFPVIVIH